MTYLGVKGRIWQSIMKERKKLMHFSKDFENKLFKNDPAFTKKKTILLKERFYWTIDFIEQTVFLRKRIIFRKNKINKDNYSNITTEKCMNWFDQIWT